MPNLLVGPVFYPVRVVEHQNVRSGYGAPGWAFWYWRNEPKIALVNHKNHVICGPGTLRAFVDALQPVNRSVAFCDAVLIESSFLEMSIYVAREYEPTTRHLSRPTAQDVETTVRLSAAIQVQPMSVEGPRKRRVAPKTLRRRDFLEADSGSSQCWVRTPEAIRTSKIWQSGVNTHTGTRSDEQAVSITQPLGSAFDCVAHFPNPLSAI
jgi:hypothetical protein